MKILKICIIAVSLGVFATSCRNSECATTTTTETSATAPATASPADGTQAVAEPVDTAAQTGDMEQNNAPKESTARNTGKHTPGKVYIPAKKNTTATSNGPDLEASKKREGNFTHGTGLENPGK